MGITGLLPLLRSITKRVHIETLAGQSVAIDAYSWLHKGVYLCAHDLFHHRPTNGYVEYCMTRIRMLKQYNIRPILVFDGAPLPMKAGKESSRLKNREESREKALEYIKKGDHKSASTHIHKSIDVTPDMAYILIQELKRHHIDFVVAPYEADAQMAFLDLIGEVAAIITEDSDMILFGCRKILYKLDKHGFADEVNLEHLGQTKDIELAGFTLERFRQMCILSGCDYLESIGGFGLKTCHKYFVKYKSADRVLQAIRAEFPSRVPDEFEKSFLMAELTFRHQRVYDHRCQELVHLHPVSEELLLSLGSDDFGNWDFVGPHIHHAMAKEIANGRVNPITRLPFVKQIEPSSTQESLQSQTLVQETPQRIVKSRFFKTIPREEHLKQTEARLTIKPRSIDAGKENVAPISVSQTRSMSTKSKSAVTKSRFSFASRPLNKDLPNIPNCLYSRSSTTSSTKPLRLDPEQPTMHNFFRSNKPS